MDVKKNFRDAGYIAVGAGVIGFQQAQVRRRELTNRIAGSADGTRSCVGESLGAVPSRIAGGAGRLGERITDSTGLVADQINTSVTSGAGTVWDVASSTAWETAQNLKDRAGGLAGGVAGRVDPVIDELKVLVEPLFDQLTDVGGRLSRAVSTGPGRVLSVVGSESAA